MLKFKLGLLLGFAAGWAVGTGRAAELWDQMQRGAGRRVDDAVPTGATTTFGHRTDDAVRTDDRSVVA
jgi:hypothetical protein